MFVNGPEMSEFSIMLNGGSGQYYTMSIKVNLHLVLDGWRSDMCGMYKMKIYVHWLVVVINVAAKMVLKCVICIVFDF